MASESRTPTHPLSEGVGRYSTTDETGGAHAGPGTLQDALEREPSRFDFLQALRIAECANRHKPRLGTSTRPADDPVRLGQEPSLIFAPSTIAAARRESGGTLRILQRALGLFGPNGPLPLHLTEHARARQRSHDDPTFARFVDLLHHRLLSLFYRAWADAQPTVHQDRPDDDRFAKYVGSLAGLGQKTLWNRDALPDHAKFHFTGWLSAQTRCADGLEAMVGALFDADVRLEQFVGHWMPIPEECRTRLGDSRETGTLGQGAMLGSRVWDRQSLFRLVVGPLSFEQYERLLPDGEARPALVAAIRNYVGYELRWDVNLILRSEEVPRTELGRSGQLGRTCWIHNRPLAHDADDLTLHSTAFDAA